MSGLVGTMTHSRGAASFVCGVGLTAGHAMRQCLVQSSLHPRCPCPLHRRVADGRRPGPPAVFSLFWSCGRPQPPPGLGRGALQCLSAGPCGAAAGAGSQLPATPAPLAAQPTDAGDGHVPAALRGVMCRCTARQVGFPALGRSLPVTARCPCISLQGQKPHFHAFSRVASRPGTYTVLSAPAALTGLVHHSCSHPRRPAGPPRAGPIPRGAGGCPQVRPVRHCGAPPAPLRPMQVCQILVS